MRFAVIACVIAARIWTKTLKDITKVLACWQGASERHFHATLLRRPIGILRLPTPCNKVKTKNIFPLNQQTQYYLHTTLLSTHYSAALVPVNNCRYQTFPKNQVTKM